MGTQSVQPLFSSFADDCSEESPLALPLSDSLEEFSSEELSPPVDSSEEETPFDVSSSNSLEEFSSEEFSPPVAPSEEEDPLDVSASDLRDELSAVELMEVDEFGVTNLKLNLEHAPPASKQNDKLTTNIKNFFISSPRLQKNQLFVKAYIFYIKNVSL